MDLESSLIKQLLSLNYYEPYMFGVPWAGGLSLSVDHQTVQNVLQDFLPPVFTDAQQPIAAPDPYATSADYLAALAAGVTIPAQYLMSYESYDLTLGATTGTRLPSRSGASRSRAVIPRGCAT